MLNNTTAGVVTPQGHSAIFQAASPWHLLFATYYVVKSCLAPGLLSPTWYSRVGSGLPVHLCFSGGLLRRGACLLTLGFSYKFQIPPGCVWGKEATRASWFPLLIEGGKASSLEMLWWVTPAVSWLSGCQCDIGAAVTPVCSGPSGVCQCREHVVGKACQRWVLREMPLCSDVVKPFSECFPVCADSPGEREVVPWWESRKWTCAVICSLDTCLWVQLKQEVKRLPWRSSGYNFAFQSRGYGLDPWSES